MDIVVHTFLSEGQRPVLCVAVGYEGLGGLGGAEKLEEGQLLSQFCLHQPSSQSWLPIHHHRGH